MRKAFRIVIAAACVVLAVFAVVTWMEKSGTPEPALTEPGQSSTETAEPEGFRKRTVIDNEICQIILTDFDAHYSPGPAFRVLVQNRSEQELLVSANAYVNRYACRPTWAEKQWSDDGPNSYLLGDFYLVAQSGERFDTWLYWKPDVLAESDVKSIDAVSFTFHVNEKEENREGAAGCSGDCEVILRQDADLAPEDMTVLADREQFAVRARLDGNAEKITVQYENRSDQPLVFLIYSVNDHAREDLSAEIVKENATVRDKIPLEALGTLPLTLEVQDQRRETDEDGNEIVMDGAVLFSAPVDLNSLS